jgi:hypothetical protein
MVKCLFQAHDSLTIKEYFMQGIAYVFLNRNGAAGLGHVGGAFLMTNGQMRCFATENLPGKGITPAAYKSCWIEDSNNDLASIVQVFQKPRSVVVPAGVAGIAPGTYTNHGGNNYTDWKMLEASSVDPDQANRMLNKRRTEDYNILNRNCENDVYDVLHDEGSGYGITANSFISKIYVGWVQTSFGPNAWFDDHIGATDSGSL